jgi:hypothetical protein
MQMHCEGLILSMGCVVGNSLMVCLCDCAFFIPFLSFVSFVCLFLESQKRKEKRLSERRRREVLVHDSSVWWLVSTSQSDRVELARVICLTCLLV